MSRFGSLMRQVSGKGESMSKLKELVEKRIKIGKTVITADKKNNFNNKLEYERYKDLIVEEVYRMYKAGELN